MKSKIFLFFFFCCAAAPSYSQAIWHLFYDYWPSGNSFVPVSVKDKNGVPVGSFEGNKEFGLGAKVIVFGKAENYIRFAFMANYRRIQLSDAYRLADSANKIQTVEYMLGGAYRPSKSAFHIGNFYSYFHASAVAGIGWSYNFDACLSGGFCFYPIHGNTENASGIDIEFVYWPVAASKSLNWVGVKQPYVYTVQPSWSLRLGFVFNSHINTTFQ